MKYLVWLLIILGGCFNVSHAQVQSQRQHFTNLDPPIACVSGHTYTNPSLNPAKAWVGNSTGGCTEIDASAAAPNGATYITQTPNSSLSNEQALSLLATGIPLITTATGVISISSVTNDVQTKASIVPNTAPSAGQVLCGNAGGTAYAPCTVGTDATLGSTGALTLATVNANTGSFGSATQSLTVTYDAKGRATGVVAQTVTPAVGSITGLGTGIATWLGTPSSANLRAAVTDENGTGVALFDSSTSATFISPILGTPTSVTLTNATGLPVAGLSNLGTNVGTFLITPSSANFFAAISDEAAGGSVIGSNVATLSSLTSIGTIGTGTWQATVINSTYGGMGVNNGGRTLTLNTNSGTFVFSAASKTVTFGNTLTLNGTDSTTMTFPTTSATLARTDAANTFTGHQTIEGVTSTGATGTGNFVFSISPTFTGTPILPTPFTIGAVSMTATGTQLNYLNAATGTTGTTSTNVVFSTSPTIATPTFTTSITSPLVVGGTTTTSPLTLRSTSGVGASGADIIFQTGNNGGTEAGRFLNAGTLVIGNSTSIGRSIGQNIETDTSAGFGGAVLATWSAASVIHNSYLEFDRSRSSTKGTHAVVQSGDLLGTVAFSGSDGTAFINAASIVAVSDGTPGTNDMPGRLEFSTTADGASGTTVQMTIKSTGVLNFNTANYNTCTSLNTTAGVMGCTVSDERVKNSITPFTDSALNIIRKIQPITFQFNRETVWYKGRAELGLSAQNLKAANPMLASLTGNKDGLLQPEPLALHALEIQGINELRSRVEMLEQGKVAHSGAGDPSGYCNNAYYQNLTSGAVWVCNDATHVWQAANITTGLRGTQAKRVSTGSLLAGISANVTVTFDQVFPDANYTLSAVVESGQGLSVFAIDDIVSRVAGSCVVRVKNLSLSTASGMLHVIAIHD